MLIASTVGPISTKLLPTACRAITQQLCRTPSLPTTYIRTSRSRVPYVPLEPTQAFSIPPPVTFLQKTVDKTPSVSHAREEQSKTRQNRDRKQGGGELGACAPHQPQSGKKKGKKKKKSATGARKQRVWDRVEFSEHCSGVGPSTVKAENALAEQQLRDHNFSLFYDHLQEGWEDYPLHTSMDGLQEVDREMNLIHIIERSTSATDVWQAYTELREYYGQNQSLSAGLLARHHLHRLIRVLSESRPKTRTQFIRLLDVIQFLQKCGGKVQLHEWNALIHNAGRGWRKTRVEDFQLVMDVYNDMVTGVPAGTTMAGSLYDNAPLQGKPVHPDIITFTSVLDIAARTLHAPSIRRATGLLHDARLSPNRITHLSMLRYFILTRQLSGVRSTVLKMKEQGLELGIDGLNACIWAYSRAGDLEMVRNIYRVLRHRIWPEDKKVEVDAIMRLLKTEEGIDMEPHLAPDEITFFEVVQAMAYHGDLLGSLNALTDMLSAPTSTKPDMQTDTTSAPSHPSTMPAFRAIFLGFAKHGVPQTDPSAVIRHSTLDAFRSTRWNHQSLLSLFEVFMGRAECAKPSRSVIYWIIVAFMKTSMHDPTAIREVWLRMESRFNGPWGGMDNRLQRLRQMIFSNEFLHPPTSPQLQKRKVHHRTRM
ncbi:Pentatricopeptide repeat protein [Pleurotus pulmonarius]